MSTLERAIQIAVEAHTGQIDKGGEPYILHPLRVMLSMSTAEERIVAVLHDVVEDSHFTFASLESEGFQTSIIGAVKALTKYPGETRVEAARRATGNPIAHRVKLADNTENMDLSRISNPTNKDLARLKEYEKVRSILVSGSAA